MSLAVLLHAIGTIPLFASRAFLPAFLTSLLFRFPNIFPFTEVDAPSAELFITKTPVIIVLGILARFSEFDIKLFNEVKLDEKPVEKIQCFVQYHFNFLEKNPGMTSVVFAEEIFTQSNLIREKMLSIMEKRKRILRDIIDEAKSNNQVIDLETDEILTVILGIIRLAVLEWRMSGFAFSLSKRGAKTVDTIGKLLLVKK